MCQCSHILKWYATDFTCLGIGPTRAPGQCFGEALTALDLSDSSLTGAQLIGLADHVGSTLRRLSVNNACPDVAPQDIAQALIRFVQSSHVPISVESSDLSNDLRGETTAQRKVL